MPKEKPSKSKLGDSTPARPDEAGRRDPAAAAERDVPAPGQAPEASDREAKPSPCLIVGCGASAGGLEAFTELLNHLPTNAGVAIVFIQHLDPTHASVLTELLSRSTRMPVTQVTNGMPIEPNRVYVIPPNSNIALRRAVLYVEPRPPGAPHLPIDHFFRSLAEDQGGKAVGVVLSGTASDGTRGLKAMKAEGSITFAQAPESARYDSMPRSAIASEAVDFVLPPHAIASELVRLCRHPYISRPRPAETEAADRDFTEIFSMLRNVKGVDFSEYKPGTVRRRTLRRMALHKLETPDQYVRYLRGNRDEMELLFQDILINVTGFFREPDTFEAIRSLVLPAMLDKRLPDETVRVWVPGCATGEEAYSIAITLFEHIRGAQMEVPIQIFGTDLSELALEKARAGVYPESISADVSPERIRRFFTKVDGKYQIARFVRDVCVFARQDVTKDPPFSKLDLITCRNVLIYLGVPLQMKVMRLFHYGLKPGGVLVLGASESIGHAGDLFAPIDRRFKIYTRKSVPATISTEFTLHDEHAREPARQEPEVQAGGEVRTQVDQVILSRFSPPSIIVDKELRILESRGNTSPYIVGTKVGDVNLARIARSELGPQIHSLVARAGSNSGVERSQPISFHVGDEVRSVRLSVTLIPGLPERQFLVVFEEPPAEPKQAPPKAPLGTEVAGGERVRELEEELTHVKDYLRSLIEEHEAATEELKSAHEEVQSSNEELQSTNEELLTAKEELQSTNEELTTVNEEMQGRNAELQQINNDLLNLLSSANIPIMMLGSDLRMRRFTPQAVRILNLLPTDVGRPITDFRLKINVPDLGALCQEVIDTLAAREREVQDSEGRTYTMWVRPYRTSDNRIEGVVLALVDITERRQAAEARFRRLFETAKDGIVIVDAGSGEIVDSNPLVTKLFGYPRAKLIGVKFWQSPLFTGTEVDESIRLDVQGRDSVQKTLWLPAESGQRVEVDVVASFYAEGEKKIIQFNVRDISARRRIEEKLQRNEEYVRQSQKMEAVGRLAGGVAHDFNNLLTAIIGYADLLSQELDAAHPGRQMLDQIRTGAERAATLTKQLLAFGRKEVVSPEVLDVNDVIVQLTQMANVTLSEDIRLEMDLRPETGRVRADQAQLEQVVLNLVLNARDAMPDGGVVKVGTTNVDIDESFSERHPSVPVGRYVAISVQDTGTGMDMETRSHLFEPFFTTKARGAGTGLGLSTAYNIVRQSGGYIAAYSELGVGSTFTVYLPRVEGKPAGEAEPSKPSEEELRGTETVLVVEDEPAVRKLTRRFLEMRGYRVLEASSGPDGLRVSRQYEGRIHLMVTDVVMPRMSGRELAFQLASERSDMRVIYMSGHTEDAIIHHGVLREGVPFLHKPFTQDALARIVRRVLDHKPGPDGPVSGKKAQ